MLRIGIVIQNLIDSRGIGGELLRALMSTFFKHCVLRAEQRSAFLQVSFTYAKIFLAAFVKKRKKGEEEEESWAISFFSQLPQNGVDIVFKTLIDLKWQQRLLQTQALAVPTRFFCFWDLNASNLRAFKVILITVMLAHLQLKPINLSSKLSHNYCWAVEIWPKNWELLLSETQAVSQHHSPHSPQHCWDSIALTDVWGWSLDLVTLKWSRNDHWGMHERGEPFLEFSTRPKSRFSPI